MKQELPKETNQFKDQSADSCGDTVTPQNHDIVFNIYIYANSYLLGRNELKSGLPSLFILIGDMNTIWGNAQHNNKGNTLEDFIQHNELCLWNDNTQTYILTDIHIYVIYIYIYIYITLIYHICVYYVPAQVNSSVKTTCNPITKVTLFYKKNTLFNSTAIYLLPTETCTVFVGEDNSEYEIKLVIEDNEGYTSSSDIFSVSVKGLTKH